MNKPRSAPFYLPASGLAICCVLFLTEFAPAQTAPPAAEMNLRETPATFQTRVNLVMVPVIVRDRRGRAVADLKQDDFQLFDKGKPQVISKFSIERPGLVRPRPGTDPAANPPGEAPPTAMTLPERFIAVLFDDIHSNFPELVHARDAAARFITTSLKPEDRLAIYTTSGQTSLPFTDDRSQLQDTLARLRPHPIARTAVSECPTMDYYLADLIQNKNDARATQALIGETIVCAQLQGNGAAQTAASMVRSAAVQWVASGEQETRVALSTIREVVRTMSAMPGHRLVILASVGFLTPNQQFEKNDIIDRAIRSSVIISALDARGLYVVDGLGDIAIRQSAMPETTAMRGQFAHESALEQGELLAELAAGTGGTHFHNSNDLGGGFERLGASPEVIYMLGFSPQNLKMDGSFHGLKVGLKTHTKDLALQARRGYYAPKHLADPAERAKREIEEAVFSRDEMGDIPVELHNQFFKTGDDKARVSVIARITLATLPFKKLDGRNRDDLTVVSALFDHNGNYVIGNHKVVEMRLLDSTLEKQRSAITLRTNFDVIPGGYMIRVVVRDSEGQMMAARNGAVEIP